MMKDLFRNIAVIALLALTLTSCDKDPVKDFEGRYSYKISGKVVLLPTAYVNATDEEKQMMEASGAKIEKTVVALYPEQGQMHLDIKDKSQDLMVMTLNDITGNVCSAEVKIDDDTVTVMEGAEKSATLTDGSDKIGGGFVSWTGAGVRYGGQLIFKIEYQGNMTVQGNAMTIVESSVECVAVKN